MHIFDVDTMHGNVYNRLNIALGALKRYAIYHNKNVVINRMYLSGTEIKLNISINGCMFLLTMDQDRITISKFNAQTSVSTNYPITIDQIDDGTFMENLK
jgi:hypothetical protein